MDGAAVVVVHRALVARRFLWRREALEMARNVVRRMERSIGGRLRWFSNLLYIFMIEIFRV